MEGANFVIVHPDSTVIPDDGGCFQQLGYRIIIHRDPSASVADIVAPTTALVLFAAQLDSDLAQQVCHILANSRPKPMIPLFFWGPGCSAPLLEKLWESGASDCFPETSTPSEIFLRISKQLNAISQDNNREDLKGITEHYNKTVRELAHDLKNPLCILHGYAQMAQMGQEISPDEAKDMLSSSREICEIIDTSLSSVGSDFFSAPQESTDNNSS